MFEPVEYAVQFSRYRNNASSCVCNALDIFEIFYFRKKFICKVGGLSAGVFCYLQKSTRYISEFFCAASRLIQPEALGHFYYDLSGTDEFCIDLCHVCFLSRTPGPSPFSATNSTPASSKARWMAETACPGPVASVSARVTVLR